MTSIAERHKYILESLAKNGFIKVNEIAKELEVTPVTIRKDLKHLEVQARSTHKHQILMCTKKKSFEKKKRKESLLPQLN